MSTAWTAAEAVAATGGRLSGAGNWRAAGVSIDSRSDRLTGLRQSGAR